MFRFFFFIPPLNRWISAGKLFLLFSLLLLISFPLFSQWEASLKYAYRPGFNTLLYLKASEDLPDEAVEYEVSFRLRDSHRNVFVKKGLIRTQPGKVQPFPVKLPKGDFQVEIDIAGTFFQEIPYTSLGRPQGFEASDLFLSLHPIAEFPPENPMMAAALPEASEIHFFLELYASSYSLLTARAVLYQETPGRGVTKATTFSSRQQISRLLPLEQGKGSFSGSFELEALPEGSYLVEILIFDEGRQLGEKSARFVLPWKGKQRIFADLPAAVEQLAYLASPAQIARLRALQESGEREAAFRDFWEHLYPGEGETQMEQYYRKIYEAEKRFGGWQNDRARIFVLYGEPQVEKVVAGGKTLERWKYPNWQLHFDFVEEGVSYRLLR